MKATLLLSLMLSSLLIGCAYPGVGEKQADVPPQIIIRNDQPTWDNPGAFGPVPEELKATAAKVCGSLDTEKRQHEARGYHAKALDQQGKPFRGGGYYCTPKQ
jgi:hypothetical protein